MVIIGFCAFPLRSFRFSRPRRVVNRTSLRGLKTNLPTISDGERTRNIGIIAHIDAGKTTVTEQLLFLAGTTQSIGSVDAGSTVTDFMEIERERGITIQSASISSSWRDHRINLIDTPGHVDFTVEVERSLRVLDGAVTVLDGSAGVQAQTLTVWRQASKFSLPSVFFINKMDKPTADFGYSLDSIEERLNTIAVPLVLPFLNEENGQLEGFVDVLHNRYLKFARLDRSSRDHRVQQTRRWEDIRNNSRLEKLALSGFEDVCLSLADVNEEFEQQLSRVQDSRQIPVDNIIEALRSSTLAKKLSPVVCGSALHCSASVRPVLDMVVDCLPGPSQRNVGQHVDEQVQSCAIVFKVSHDSKQGQLNYVRIFKGSIESASSKNSYKRTPLMNANSGVKQNDYQIFTPFSDYLEPVSRVENGNIAVFTGLTNTKTGDTLVNLGPAVFDDLRKLSKETNHPTNNNKSDAFARFALEGIDAPLPVFSCAIEAPNLASERQFLRAISELLIEDPSLRVREDPNSGQKILEGMGELQIEVFRERILREYNLDVFIGPLRLAYRETPVKSVEHSESVEEPVAHGGRKKSWIALRLRVEPFFLNESQSGFEQFKSIEVALESDNRDELETASQLLASRLELKRAIEEGCVVSLFNGPAMGFPVANIRILLKSFTFSGRIQSTLLSACASRCLERALQKSAVNILEPLMQMEVTVVAGDSGVADTDSVLHELTSRRARILGVDSQRKTAIVHAEIPLAGTIGLAKVIRSISSGLASFHMQQKGYQPVELEDVRQEI